jgi:hypothetical protein
MKTIYLATAESRNFSFEAIGETYNEAIKALHKGLKIHAKQYGLAPKWFEEWADIQVNPLTIGEVYRDGSQLKGTTK